MKQKICMTTLEFPPDVGGVGESVKRIATMLLEMGYDVHITVFRAIFRNERAMATAGDYHRAGCDTTRQDGLTVHRLYPAVRSPQAKQQDYLCDIYDQLQQLHRTYQYDILHAFFINEMGFLTTLLGQENGIPAINSIRGADLNKHVFSPQQFSQITWTLSHSDWSTFVSRDLMHRARTLVPAIRPKSSAFWNSIDPLTFKEVSQLPLTDQLQETVIGSVGNFRDKKGLEYLFDACQSLRHNTDLTLLLVGDFADKERDYWAQALHNSGFADRVVITGKVSRQKALAYLSYMDIFAIPSIHDGCPNALIEAMLAAKAIVGTQVDAIGEILEEGVNGLVVPPGDTQALAEALRRLIAQPAMRQQLGIAARQKALSRLAPDVEKENWRTVYQTVLKGHSRAFKKALTVV